MSGNRYIHLIWLALAIFTFSSIGIAADSTGQKSDKKENSKTKQLLQKLLEESKKEVDKKSKKDSQDYQEIDGLVINDTRTKIGQDFYENFYTTWEAPPQSKNYTIFIAEKAAGSWGTWILVSINETLVYQNRITPRLEEIENAVQYAVSYTANFLINYEENQKQLAGDDMKGSGIH